MGANLKLIDISAGAFFYCESLTDITLPNTVTNIDNNAFFGCVSLTNITIPDSVKTIGAYTFFGCENLTTVNFGINSVLEEIYENAFENTAIVSLTIYSTKISVIERHAFAGSSLTSITFYATVPPAIVADTFADIYITSIYVPTDSVGAYKSATAWTDLADYIFEITE